MTGDSAHILLPTALDRGFDYAVPEGMGVAPGDLVRVTLASREMVGVVWQVRADESPRPLKPILARCDTIPPFSEPFRRWLEWVASYTLAPKGAVLQMALSGAAALAKPPRVKAEKPAQPARMPTLSPAQQKAFAALCAEWERPTPRPLVLDGVTGSGKTEVYFHAIAHALESNPQAQVLVLLPEIALTHQWLARFEEAFGFAPALWHSQITPAARKRAYLALARGEARVVVGARSALFLPYPSLALIVVDEEHEPSYKQEDGVLYHARDMAVARAAMERIPILLVSATPSLETQTNVASGKYAALHLTERFAGAALPDVSLIDMRTEKLDSGTFLSPALREAMIDSLARGEQALLFLNRRGYAPLVLCRHCGHRFQCSHCSAWLVMHRGGIRGQGSGVRTSVGCEEGQGPDHAVRGGTGAAGRPPANNLHCHHCGHREPVPEACPACEHTGTLAPCGPGVERVAEEVSGLFPEARISLLSSDGGGVAPEEIEAILAGERDILIGTQMVAKGHHFPRLTLVGVVDADMGLAGGDLRASERCYQLLHQLSGRAGRAESPGRVLLQTYQPEHPVMQALAAGDGASLMRLEREGRKHANWPPYGQLASLLFDGPDETEVRRSAEAFVRAGPRDRRVQVLGPAPAFLSRLKGKYRYRVLVKTTRAVDVQKLLTAWQTSTPLPRRVRLKVDVNPYSFV